MGEIKPNQGEDSMVKAVWLLALLIAIIAVIFYASTLGNRSIATRGEGREALVVSGIIEQQKVLLPRRNGIDVPSKPPLFHWLAAVSSTGTGGQLNEFAIRFPSAAAAAFTLLVTFAFFAFTTGSRSLAGLSVLLLASTFEFMRCAGHARVDMVFSLSLTLAFVTLYRLLEHLETSKKTYVFWSGLSTLAILSAVLAKGPAGFLIPAIVVSLYCLITAKPKSVASFAPAAFLLVPPFALAFLAAGAWYTFAYIDGGTDFVKRQLIGENLARLVAVAGYDMGHHRPLYYSLIDLVVGFLPISFFLPSLLQRLWGERKELLNPENRLMLFSCLWILVFLLAVTVSSSKREVYFLPVYPQLTFLLAGALRLKGITAWNKALSLLFTVAAAILVLALVVPSFYSSGADFSRVLNLEPWDTMYLVSVYNSLKASLTMKIGVALAAVFLFLAGLALWRSALKSAARQTCVAVFFIAFVVNSHVLPSVTEIGSPVKFVSQLKTIVGDKAPLFQYHDNFYATNYYIGRPVSYTGFCNELKQLPEGYILAKASDESALLQLLPGSDRVLESENLAANGQEKLILFRYRSPSSAAK